MGGAVAQLHATLGDDTAGAHTPDREAERLPGATQFDCGRHSGADSHGPGDQHPLHAGATGFFLAQPLQPDRQGHS